MILLAIMASISFLLLSWSPIWRRWAEIQLGTFVDAPPDAPPYTAVVVYLVTLSRVSELLESLASIDANLPGPSWPIVLFHTGDFDDKHEHTGLIAQVQIYIGERNGSLPFAKRIEFAKLDWKLPVGIPADKDIVDPIDSGRWPGKPAIDEVLLVAAC